MAKVDVSPKTLAKQAHKLTKLGMSAGDALDIVGGIAAKRLVGKIPSAENISDDIKDRLGIKDKVDIPGEYNSDELSADHRSQSTVDSDTKTHNPFAEAFDRLRIDTSSDVAFEKSVKAAKGQSVHVTPSGD